MSRIDETATGDMRRLDEADKKNDGTSALISTMNKPEKWS
jgi:hypothetical protein